MTTLHYKVPDKDIDPENIWDEDKLDFQTCAKTLTNLIIGQENPFVISLNAPWGTGKTFLLKRWHKQLLKDNFKAIYFNAWEDDYCHDPLVAIIGQIWDEVKGSDYEEIINSIKEAAKPFFYKTVFNAVKCVSAGVVDATEKDFKSSSEEAIEEYSKQRQNKDDLKKKLIKLAKKIYGKEQKPLVFIVDELDRCRPTFAIELLERIKHIFDVQGMLFVLGIDQTQLGNSIKAVYGNINVEGYLKRFIDFNFLLPLNTQEEFCKHLWRFYNIDSFIELKTQQASNSIHSNDLNTFKEIFPKLSKGFNFTLREIEYAIRIFICVIKNTENKHYMYPVLTSVLIILKIRNQDLYHKYSSGKTRSSEVSNYILENLDKNPHIKIKRNIISTLEGHIYATEEYDFRNNPILEQLGLLRQKKNLTRPQYLSNRTKNSDDEQIEDIYRVVYNNCHDNNISSRTIDYLSRKIELNSMYIKE